MASLLHHLHCFGPISTRTCSRSCTHATAGNRATEVGSLTHSATRELPGSCFYTKPSVGPHPILPSSHPSLLPSSIYLPKLLPCPASHPQMSLLCLVVLLPASPFHALPPSQRKNTRCFSGCLLQRSSQQELTSFRFCSCPAREGSGGGAAPPRPGGGTELSEPKQASANTPAQERTSP